MKRQQHKNFAFGNQVLGLRERAGLTQRALAQLLNLSSRAVLNWESGTSYPDPARLRQLITVYLQRQAFPAGDELASAAALWELVQAHAPRRVVALDHAWLTALVQSVVAGPHGGATNPHTDTVARPAPAEQPRADWGEAVAVPTLYGREAELGLLEGWITDESCRLIALLGIGGAGKTALAVTLAHQLAPTFDVVFWRSLWNAPPLEQLLDECLRAIDGDALPALADDLDARLNRLVGLLRQQRCLLVLDNLESLLQEGRPEGRFRAGYEAYEMLIARVGGPGHRSCLLLTSREQPPGLAALLGAHGAPQLLRLGSLPLTAARALLQNHRLSGDAAAWAALCARYGGNPLALKLVAAVIGELFGGELAAFLAGGLWLPNDVRQLLDQHLRRLAPHEQTLLMWLAIAREPLTVGQLLAILTSEVTRHTALNSLEGLHRRALLERRQSDGALALQPMVLEYMTARMNETMGGELASGELVMLRHYPLAQTSVAAYVRQSQIRVLVEPLLAHLHTLHVHADAVRDVLDRLLQQLRHEPYAAQGYASSNVVTLMARLTSDLCHYDLSRLALREVDFTATFLQFANFDQAQIVQSRFAEPFDSVASLAYSPDGRYLASGAYNGDLRVWDWHNGVLLGQCRGHSSGVLAVAWSPDGKLLASAGGDWQIWLWDVPSCQQRGVLIGAASPLRALAWKSDGTQLAAAGSDGSIRIWDVAAGRCVAQASPGSDIYALAWSPNGTRLASGGSDRLIWLWDSADLSGCGRLDGHSSTVFTLMWSPDGRRLASGSYDQTIRLWEVSDQRWSVTLAGHSSSIYALAWSPDGRRIAGGGDDGAIRIWDAQGGVCQQVLSGHLNTCYTLAYSPDGTQLTSSGADSTIRLWDTASGQCLRVVVGSTNDVYTVAFHPAGRLLVSGTGDHVVRLWDTQSMEGQQVLFGHVGEIFAVAWSPDGSLLASGGQDAHLIVWALQGASYQRLRSHRVGITYAIAWSPAGTLLASGGSDGRIWLWDTQSGHVYATLVGHTSPVRALAWSPDGALLASGSYDGTVRIWNVQRRASRLVLSGHDNFVYALAWSPDGRRLASGGYDRSVRVWDSERGLCEAVLTGHTSPVRTLAWSPDGALLASGGYEPLVTLWSADSWQQQATVSHHDSLVFALAWSPDGATLVVGRSGGLITLWHRPTETLSGLLRCGRPYEQVTISGVTGLSEAQRATLIALGAVDEPSAATDRSSILRA